MRRWRRVRALADDLEASPDRDALRTRAGVGILSVSWRLGISPQEAAAIHAEAHVDLESFRGELYCAGSLMHGGRERAGLDRFRTAGQEAFAVGDVGRALTAATGVAYASWVAGSLAEAVETLDRALALAGDDPATGSGISFVCPLAHAFQTRGMSVGYTGQLEQARRDLDRGTALATREYDDPQTESACHANRALLEAHAGQLAAALRSSAQVLLATRGAAAGERIEGVLVHALSLQTAPGRSTRRAERRPSG